MTDDEMVARIADVIRKREERGYGNFTSWSGEKDLAKEAIIVIRNAGFEVVEKERVVPPGCVVVDPEAPLDMAACAREGPVSITEPIIRGYLLALRDSKAPAELEALLKKALAHEMTPEELFEQKVSFVYGQMMNCNPEVTKDSVREMLRKYPTN